MASLYRKYRPRTFAELVARRPFSRRSRLGDRWNNRPRLSVRRTAWLREPAWHDCSRRPELPTGKAFDARSSFSAAILQRV